MTLSPDGQFVATIDQENHETAVWETDTARKRVSLPEALTTNLRQIAFSRDGKVLAIASPIVSQDGLPTNSESGVINLWDLGSGKKIRSIGEGKNLVWAISFSPDGKTLATCDREGGVQLWDVASGRGLPTMEADPERRFLNDATFSPDGKYLAALTGRDVIIWEVETRKRLAILTFEWFGPPLCLTFSPDGRFLATGGAYIWSSLLRGRLVIVWEAGTWQKHSVVKGRIAPWSEVVWRLAFSPDSSRLALGSSDGSVGLVEIDR